MKYSHLDEKQRKKIASLHFKGYTMQAIADAVSVDKATISRELKRNSVKKTYKAPVAEKLYLDRRKESKAVDKK